VYHVVRVTRTRLSYESFPQRSSAGIELSPKMHDQYTERVQQCNILDTTVHESLGWTAHTDTIVINISRTIDILNKSKHKVFPLKIISKIQKKAIQIIFTSI